jgi:hypothetical protein
MMVRQDKVGRIPITDNRPSMNELRSEPKKNLRKPRRISPIALRMPYIKKSLRKLTARLNPD